MSVLIEALCVVIPTKQLDVSFPGATEAFVSAAGEARWEARFALRDQHLVV